MSRRATAVAAWVGMALAAVGSASADDRGHWAASLFQESGHDFGPVPRGAVVRHPFVLANRLREPVTILDIRASCGCTSGRASAATVPAGGSAVVEAQMDTRNFAGHKATTLTVSLVTASGAQAEVKFGVSAEILADIVLNPGTVDFGAVSKGQAPNQVLTIERLGAPSWRFTRMDAPAALRAAVDAQLVETYRSAQGVGYSLTVTLKPDAPAGFLRDQVTIHTNDPESPTVPVLVTASIRGSLTASPPLLSMGTVASASGAQGRILVKGSAPFEITALEGSGDGFALTEAEPGRKALHVLTVTYRPDEGTTRGDLRRPFRVTTDLPGEPPLDVAATLHVSP